MSPERLSWVTTGTNPSAPNLTADSRLFSDTERKYRQVVRLSKAVGAPYFADIHAVLPGLLFPSFSLSSGVTDRCDVRALIFSSWVAWPWAAVMMAWVPGAGHR